MTAQIIITGNIGNDIETFTFGQGGEGLKFDVAVTTDQRGEQVTRWYHVAAFGKIKDQGLQLQQEGQLATGSKALVMGAFLPRDFTTRSGETKTSFDITASSIEILFAKQQRQQPTVEDQYSEGFEYADDDDEPSF